MKEWIFQCFKYLGSCVIVGNVMIASPVRAEPPHPILDIPASGSISAANTILSNWTEAEYIDQFIPRQAPRDEDSNFASMVVPGDTSWSWSQSAPHQLTSKPSNTVFPGAAGYPEFAQSVVVMDGSTVQVPYYQALNGSKALLQAVIDFQKRDKLRGDLATLSHAYMISGTSHATRNQNYARRIAVSLYEVSLNFPKYFMNDLNRPDFINGGPTFVAPHNLHRASSRNGLGEEWKSSTDIYAFDAIYDSTVWASLDAEKGFDVRSYIADNLLGNEGDFIVNHVPPAVATESNISDTYVALARVARILGKPDYIDWLDRYLKETVVNKLQRDGGLSEGIGYAVSYGFVNTNVAQTALEYFLSRPADTPQLLMNKANLERYLDLLNAANQRWSEIALPNGQLPSFGDTHFGTYFSARDSGNSALMPAFGTLSLGAGSGSQAVQLNQNFSGDNNHMRSDMAALSLWAFDTEFLGNIRYHNTMDGRQLTEQMLAHNTVAIDRNDASSRDADKDGNGDLTLFEPGNHGLAVTEIDGQRTYSNEASRFQRIVMLNSSDLAHPYLVDVFRVDGGQTHDYILHASLRYDQTWECSFPLTPDPSPYPMLEGGETWSEPTGQYDSFPYWGVWRDVSKATAPGDFQITYRDDSSANRDLRLWVTDDGSAQVNIGRTPVPSRAALRPKNLWDSGWWRPSSVIRKRISSGTLQSLFVSVIEPMKNGVDGITSVTRLPMAGDPLESCALRISFADGREDTYVVNLRNPQVNGAGGGAATVSTADGLHTLTGRIGAYSSGPSGSRVWTVKADDFQYPGHRFAPAAQSYAGTITGELRLVSGQSADAFLTNTPLPLGDSLKGRQLMLKHGTLSSPTTQGIKEPFEIDSVEFANNHYQVNLCEDHQLEIAGTSSSEQMAPHRTFNGLPSFEINLSASTTPITGLQDLVLTVNGVSPAVPFHFDDLGPSPAATLQVSAESSNPSLIPYGNLFINGTGGDRTLTVQPLAGQTGVAIITVTITDGAWSNQSSFRVTVIGPDFEDPQVGITSPAAGAVVSPLFPVLVSASVTDNTAVLDARLFVDGDLFGSDDTPPYEWRLTDLSNGPHYLEVVGTDLSGNTGRAAAFVRIDPFSPVAQTLLGDPGDASVYENSNMDANGGTSLLGAGGSNPWVDRCTIYVFKLPDLGNQPEPFASATFSFFVSGRENTLRDNDLYGLGRRPNSTVFPGDYYGQSAVPDGTDAIPLQQQILINETPDGLVSTSLQGSEALRSYLNAQYDSGAGAGEYVFLRLNTAGTKNGIRRATLIMSEGAQTSPVNTWPRIDFTSIPAAPVQGLVGHWAFDEGGGNIATDSSGSGNIGTLVNSPVWSGDAVRASFLDFNGVDQAVQTSLQLPKMIPSQDFTWSFWANYQGTAPNEVIIGNRYNGPGTSDNTPREWVKFTPTKFEFRQNDLSQTINYADLPSGEWHQHAVVKSGTTFQYYLDGAPVGGPQTMSSDGQGPLPFFIGGNPGAPASEHFTGLIDEVRLYDRSLAPGEVSRLFLPDPLSGRDIDADGLPDNWEYLHFETLVPTADGDDDHDGATNGDELMAGTDPTTATSRFAVHSLDPLPGQGWTIRWKSELGRVYQVFRCFDLQSGGWQPVSGVLMGTGGMLSIPDTESLAGVSGRFYRVSVAID